MERQSDSIMSKTDKSCSGKAVWGGKVTMHLQVGSLHIRQLDYFDYKKSVSILSKTDQSWSEWSGTKTSCNEFVESLSGFLSLRTMGSGGENHFWGFVCVSFSQYFRCSVKTNENEQQYSSSKVFDRWPVLKTVSLIFLDTQVFLAPTHVREAPLKFMSRAFGHCP